MVRARLLTDLFLARVASPSRSLAIDRHLHSAFQRADARFLVFCLRCDIQELGAILHALGRERRDPRVGGLARDRAECLDVRHPADRLECESPRAATSAPPSRCTF